MHLYAVIVVGGVSCAVGRGGSLADLVVRQRQHNPEPATPAPNMPGLSTTTVSVAEDMTPAAGFLTGERIFHTLVGALPAAIDLDALEPRRVDYSNGMGRCSGRLTVAGVS